MHIQPPVRPCIHASLHVFMQICMYVCMYVYIHIYTGIGIYKIYHIYAFSHTCNYTSVYTYIYIYTCICMCIRGTSPAVLTVTCTYTHMSVRLLLGSCSSIELGMRGRPPHSWPCRCHPRLRQSPGGLEEDILENRALFRLGGVPFLLYYMSDYRGSIGSFSFSYPCRQKWE